MKLHRLPNGSWIDPSVVDQISVEGNDVVVSSKNRFCHLLAYKDEDAAVKGAAALSRELTRATVRKRTFFYSYIWIRSFEGVVEQGNGDGFWVIRSETEVPRPTEDKTDLLRAELSAEHFGARVTFLNMTPVHDE